MTWRGQGTDRLEQTRLHVNGARIKAYGRIIAAADGDREAFSASYELLTNDAGITRRLSIHLVRAAGETQLAITRDEEGNWLVRLPDGETVRSDFGGAQDVDLALSPMFNALPIRRHAMAAATSGAEIEVPVVYVYLPGADLPGSDVTAETLRYTPTDQGIGVVSPVATSTITVDEHGFVREYTGLAERV